MKRYLLLGGILAFLAVALGAFGAHLLEGKLEEGLFRAYQTGVQYQMYHALGLIGIALAGDRLTRQGQVRTAGRLITAGVVLFSGSLYVMAFTGIRVLGAITPIGGVCFLAGWALFAAAVWADLNKRNA